MGEIKYLVGLTMTVLFAIAIIGFVYNYQADNDAVVLLSNEPLVTTFNQSAYGSLQNLSEEINTSNTAFFKSTITSGDQVSSSGGQFKLTSIPRLVTGMFTLARDKLFGGSGALAIFLTALGSLIVYIGIRYAYKSWVGANPD
jgi:hypothetical protein